MANTIKTLINAGLDAFVNLYDVFITLPTKLEEITIPGISDNGEAFQNKLITRIGNFQPPDSSLGEYPVYYQAGSIVRQNSKIALNRVISLPFRIDSTYNIYKILKAWQRLYLGPNQADVRLPESTDADYFGKIEIKGYNSKIDNEDPINGEFQTKTVWTFQNVVCLDVSEPQFGRDSSNPVEISGTFLFYWLVPPSYTEDEVTTLESQRQS